MMETNQMPHYIILWNWTHQGITSLKDWAKRKAAAREAVEKAGGKWLSFYTTFGQYDGVLTVEMSSDEAAMSLVLALGKRGNIRTTTIKAFPEDEATKIIGKGS